MMISNVFSSIKQLGAIARELDEEGLTIEIRYQERPAIAIGRKGHGFLRDLVYGPIKIAGITEVIEIVQGILKK